ncbi:hypothetical protein BDY21DRAFT_357290 [Lineolata rhizophorae]|uniref:DUF7587 domain-containing protein n=1 Tax=Lineolata rhizophorae TaxID=578093 RepID=A0A6A6NNQ7_9PEZI|nr:hypothetical protein BDY21DRAFT_357290 [Lineolata rhizophorae]
MEDVPCLQMSRYEQLCNIFVSHPFAENESLDLYHVYDNLSRTPLGRYGIECDDPDRYLMAPWHVITPLKMRKHLDWGNREPTQFISFYDNRDSAFKEARRRRAASLAAFGRRRQLGKQDRDPGTVSVAHVRLDKNSNVWVFSKEELMRMIPEYDIFQMAGKNEWFVWEYVPLEHVVGLWKYDRWGRLTFRAKTSQPL